MDGRKKPGLPKVEYTKHTKHEMKRSDSFVKFTASDGSTTLYKPSKELGRGKYGKVTLFTDGYHHLVVKKPLRQFKRLKSEAIATQLAEGAEREFHYTKLAYPDKRPYSLIKYKAKNNTEPDIHYFEYRMMLPFVNGVTLYDLSLTQPDPDILLLSFYHIAKEVKRLHDLGIIHGDLSCNNIMIKSPYKIRLIDFAFAYKTEGDATLGEVAKGRCTYFAPERLNTKHCPANVNQDVFSLASTLYGACQYAMSFNERLKFFEKYPIVNNFITLGQSPIPADRPKLDDFINQLGSMLYTPKLKAALIKSDEDVAEIFSSDEHHYTLNEFFEILLDFCQSNHLHAATRLFDIVCNSHTIETKEQKLILELFSLLIEFIDKIPKAYQPNLLTMELNQFLFETLSSGLQLMDIIIRSEIKMIPPGLSAKLNANRVLEDIYRRMSETNLIVSAQTAADNLDNLLTGCTLM